MGDEIEYRWREHLTDAEVADLLAADGGSPDPGWWSQVRDHSLGWVSAHDPDGQLVGFVNVAWDGGRHAFLLDTATRPDRRHTGVGRRLVARATQHAAAAGCEWLHVDFVAELAPFYLDACGFQPTAAGLVHLAPAATGDAHPTGPRASPTGT